MYGLYMGHVWITWVLYWSCLGHTWVEHGHALVIWVMYGSTMRPRTSGLMSPQTSETSDKWALGQDTSDKWSQGLRDWCTCAIRSQLFIQQCINHGEAAVMLQNSDWISSLVNRENIYTSQQARWQIAQRLSVDENEISESILDMIHIYESVSNV